LLQAIVDLGAIENFIILKIVILMKLQTLKKLVLYKLHLANKQLAKGNKLV
jgi:hypothetical protein